MQLGFGIIIYLNFIRLIRPSISDYHFIQDTANRFNGYSPMNSVVDTKAGQET